MTRARQIANFDPALFAADEISGDKVSSGTIGGDTIINTSGAITTSGAASLTGGVGIGAAKDLGAGLHIKNGDSGSGVSANADELVIEGSGDDIGMSILNTTSGAARINFSDSGGNDRGQIRFSHDSDKMFFRTDSLDRMTIAGNGRVGIGTTSPTVTFMIEKPEADWTCNIRNTNSSSSGILMTAGASTNYQLFMMDYDGNAKHYFKANGAYYHSGSNESDERLKENIVDCEHGLAEVLQLTPRRFNFKINPDIIKHGWIAQEVEPVMPDMVRGDANLPIEGPDNGTMSMDYDGMSAVLAKAIQELSAKNDALETENTALKTRMDALEARITALEG